MKDVHPTSTAGDGQRFRDEKLRAPGEDSESLFISCPHCGWINKTNRETPPDSEGNSIVNVSTSITIPGGTKNFTEAQVQAGCSFCGHDFEVSTYRQPFFSKQNYQGR